MTEEEQRALAMADEAQRAHGDNRRRMNNAPYSRELFAGNRGVRFEDPRRAEVELGADVLLAVVDAVGVTR